MKVLIAEDDATSRLLLRATLNQVAQQAYDILLAEDAPCLAIFDWMMRPPPRRDRSL